MVTAARMEDGEMRGVSMTAAVLALSLCGCGPAEAPRKTAGAKPAPTPMSVTKAPARPVGPPARHPVIPGEEMGTAADISQFHALPRLDAKVFSLSGGDPAVNGLVTYFALFGGPSEGWSAYPLGDDAEWRVAEAKTGRVVLVVRQDTAGPAGNILKTNRTVQIDFARNGETPPDGIDVSTTQ
jgi:hypothetical protein